MSNEPSHGRPRRLVSLETGVAMIVTDLHGDWDAYCRYRDRFLALHAQGQADYFILCGDLIHYTGPAEQDKSLEMVLDVLALQAELGDRLIYLLGNHEMPHIYAITLQKGTQLFTPRFEWSMGEHRERILDLFRALPFYVRTRGGLCISHAGATAAISLPDGGKRLFDFSHERVWQETAASLPPETLPGLRRLLSRRYGRDYDEIVHEYLAVAGSDDPRYDDYLIGAVTSSQHPDFELLWDALFARNEYQHGDGGYRQVLAEMLRALSAGYYPQRVLVSGHIDCEGGYKVVNAEHLRLASAKNAHPREAGCYLLWDVAREVDTAVTLTASLGTVFINR